MTSELFESAVRGKGDLAGVFEYDGETAYFYLYDTSDENAQKIIDSVHLFSEPTDLQDADVEVRWDDAGRRVGLFLRGVQWAVFDSATGAKYGGNFGAGTRPDIPKDEAIGPF